MSAGKEQLSFLCSTKNGLKGIRIHLVSFRLDLILGYHSKINSKERISSSECFIMAEVKSFSGPVDLQPQK